MIRNHNIKRYWKNQYLAAHDFSGVRLVGSSLTALTLNEAAPPTLNTSTIVSSLYSAVNTNIVENINSLGLSGVKMNTAGDVIRHYWMPPVDLDYTQPVYARVHWTSGSSTTADTITWKLWRKNRSPNNDALTATIDTALDTVIAQDTVPAGVAFTIGITAAGKWNANAFLPSNVQELALEMDAKAGGLSEDIYALGVEFLYVPMIGSETCAINTPDLPTGWA